MNQPDFEELRHLTENLLEKEITRRRQNQRSKFYIHAILFTLQIVSLLFMLQGQHR